MLLGLLVLSAVLTGRLDAQDLSVSVQQWSFFANAKGRRVSGPGVHLSASLVWGLNPRLEASLGLLGMLTPYPGDTLAGVASVGYSLLSERWITETIPPNWIRMLIEAGAIGGVKGMYSWRGGEGTAGSGGSQGSDPQAVVQLFVRVTPLVLGNSFYRRSDGLFALGAAWDVLKGGVSLFVNLASMNVRVAPR